MSALRQITAVLVLFAFAGMQSRLAAQEPNSPTPPAEEAAPGPGAAPAGDPPARVGRLSYVSGDVSFKPAGVDQWAHATLNRPITRGDSLWTDARSRAEVHIGTLAIRLAPRSSLYVSNLDDRTVQLILTQGVVEIHVHELRQGELMELDLPNAAVTLQELGVYRADVDEGGGQSSVTVRKGNAEVMVSGTAFVVPNRHTAYLTGEHDAEHRLEDASAPDAFDDWCAERNRREENPTALRYVSRGTIGYEDLDDNGQWRQSPDYGAVWVPRAVPVGWAPYHYGHWAWVDPWGWTWVDDAPWGFAPFHYGRWVYWGSTWGWVPGPVVARPCYAPALVAFAAGATLGLAVGVGAIGWVPLGPREVWIPGYHTSYAYLRGVNGVNVTHVTNVTTNNTYMNRVAPGGVTAVSQTTFASAAPVATHAVGVSQTALSQASFNHMAAPVAPQTTSVLGANRGSGPVVQPPASAVNRQVVMRNTPPPSPTSFASRQPSLMRNPGHPVPISPTPPQGPRNNPVTTIRGSGPAATTPQVRNMPQVYHVPQPAHTNLPEVRNTPQPFHAAPPPPSHASPPMPYPSAPRYHGAPSQPMHWGGGGGGMHIGGGHRPR